MKQENMKLLLVVLVMVASIGIGKAQQDTIITYKNKSLVVCTKDSATYLVKYYKWGKV